VQGVSLDPDALLYLEAIRPHYSATWFDDIALTEEQWDRVASDLFVSQKDFSIYDKNKAFYPLAGGTDGAHKFNGKDPRDLDAAFRLTFVGSPTHSANGVQGNGSSQYANTHLSPDPALNLNSAHISFYSRTDNNAGSEMGVQQSNLNFDYTYLAVRNGGNIGGLINQDGVSTVANANGQGFYIANRTASNVKNVFKNGSKVENVTTASTARSNRPIFLLAFNNVGTASDFSSKQCAFSSIGDGLTDTDATNFNTAITNFQTALSRNV
jgi:hypothetical protein